jgi:hypothetical protein
MASKKQRRIDMISGWNEIGSGSRPRAFVGLLPSGSSELQMRSDGRAKKHTMTVNSPPNRK